MMDIRGSISSGNKSTQLMLELQSRDHCSEKGCD
jgi:hypothetical protein